MKLYKLLFESISSDQILLELNQMIKNSTSSTAEYLQEQSKDTKETAQKLYQLNKDTFDKITKNAETFKYLAGGANGDAFNLGSQILKLEMEMSWNQRFSSKIRAEKSATDLFQKPAPIKPQPQIHTSSPQTTRDIKRPITENSSQDDESIANYVPMIYDQGTLIFSDATVGSDATIAWIIMEKFEIPSDEFELELFLDAITQKFSDGYNLQDMLSQDPLDDDEKHLIKSIGQDLRLKSGWYENLITGMWKLYGKGIRDFHAGNIGIRRSGAEGTLVFFD